MAGTVFSNYSNRSSNGVLRSMKPNVHPYPWQPKQQMMPNGMHGVSLAQPQFRSATLAGPTVPNSTGTQMFNQRRMSSGGTGVGNCSKSCGGCGGCGCGGKK